VLDKVPIPAIEISEETKQPRGEQEEEMKWFLAADYYATTSSVPGIR